MNQILTVILLIALSLFWYGFEGETVPVPTGIETSYDLSGANLSGADLTGANLRGVNLDGVILCKTTMPNGTINNTGCKN